MTYLYIRVKAYKLRMRFKPSKRLKACDIYRRHTVIEMVQILKSLNNDYICFVTDCKMFFFYIENSTGHKVPNHYYH